MKKLVVVSASVVLMIVQSVSAYIVEERVFDGITPARTEWDSGVSGTDTLQAQHPDHMIVEHQVWDAGVGGWVVTTGPGWGGLTTYQAVTDAGSDWWDYGPTPTTIGVYGVGDGMIGFTFKDDYAEPWGHQFDGWTLGSITILVGEQGNHAWVNYNFRIEVRDKDTWDWSVLDMDPDSAGVQEWLTGGSDTAGYGTKIVINDINMENIRGVRITSGGLVQSDGGWGYPLINEIDIQMVPEPATMAILGLGALVISRFRKV